jgi:hypothetical protein
MSIGVVLAVLLAHADAGAAPAVVAQDLTPALGVLSVYGSVGRDLSEIRARLLDDDFHRYCQMVTPGTSFYGEGALAVYLTREGESATAVVGRIPYDRSGKKTKATMKRAALAPATADLLEQVWEMMLERVRLPPKDIELWYDTPTYYFDTCCVARMDLVGGQFVRPKGLQTRPEELARVGDALVAYVEADAKDRPRREAALVALAEPLRRELAALGAAIPDPKARRDRPTAILPRPPKRRGAR